MMVANKTSEQFSQPTFPRVCILLWPNTANAALLYRRLIRSFCTFILVATLSATQAMADDIKPFLSDGCSAFPNGTLEQRELWLSCCEAHDYTYWKGGTYQERLDADRALQQCVQATGEPEIAQLMLAGVRVGGTPFLPTRFRWGYGWPFFRGYQALSTEEEAQINALSTP